MSGRGEGGAPKDAWYTGPDEVVYLGTSYWRLPSKFYANGTGPTTLNCSVFAPEVFFANLAEMKFSFPFLDNPTELEAAAAEAHEEVIALYPDKLDRSERYKEAAKPYLRDGAIRLGDGSDEQPIVFIKESLYQKYFPLPIERLALNALLLGSQKKDLPVKFISDAAGFAAKFGEREFMIATDSEWARARFVPAHYEAKKSKFLDGREETTTVIFGRPQEWIDKYAAEHPEMNIISSEGWFVPVDPRAGSYQHGMPEDDIMEIVRQHYHDRISSLH